MSGQADPAERMREVREQLAEQNAKLATAIEQADANGHTPEETLFIDTSNGVFERLASALTKANGEPT